MQSKKYAKINSNHCVACGACVYACPKQAILMMRGRYAKVSEGLCIGCGKCAKVCPTNTISIWERVVVE